MPEIQGKLSKEMDPRTLLEGVPVEGKIDHSRMESTIAGVEDTSSRIDSLRKEMEEGQKATRREMEELEKNSKTLSASVVLRNSSSLCTRKG